METFRFLDPSVSKINERDGRHRPASFSNLKESNLKKESEDSNRNPESTYRLVGFASFSSYFSIFFLYTCVIHRGTGSLIDCQIQEDPSKIAKRVIERRCTWSPIKRPVGSTGGEFLPATARSLEFYKIEASFHGPWPRDPPVHVYTYFKRILERSLHW